MGFIKMLFSIVKNKKNELLVRARQKDRKYLINTFEDKNADYRYELL